MSIREKTASHVQTLLINLRSGPLQQPTELLRLSAQGTAKWQALIIPGNPGVASFYIPLMQGLYNKLGGLADVFCISQLGHNPQCSMHLHQGSCNLKDQIQHKAAFIKEHMLLPGRPPAFVVGHSIGAYMALHAAYQIGQECLHTEGIPEVSQIFAVCPFLAFDASNARQRFLRFVTRQPAMLGSLAALLGSLPQTVQRWIVSTHLRGLEPHARDAALGLLQWQPAVNALHLAKHEFIDLDSPAEWWLLKHFSTRVTVLCAPGDMWFPDAAYSEMQRVVPGVQALMLKGQRHSFCTSTLLSSAMADACTTILEDVARKPQAEAASAIMT
ncbi:hypothetical protein CVIRNUC_001523 [Coccomyxa viridis]|uniref:Lipid droplet-associated hydrolase n=1 Tax=Coccomyxa viridis TaxID=1274662 RepID=A0AAV1HTJ9_9CHLO|nr:hypothetical protein CVIRNUC_001523 [Coccomyxa viridis]